jgi:hypothetical protein
MGCSTRSNSNILIYFRIEIDRLKQKFLKMTAEEYEKKHVHQVYDQIAGHFSQTRYKVTSYQRIK